MEQTRHKENLAVDMAKVVFAIMVIGIHTNVCGFNIWADRLFGIISRLCVPFFFTTSAYFLYAGRGNVKKYLLRIVRLYFAWSIIYLPFMWKGFISGSALSFIKRVFWIGNENALWYLWGTVVATVAFEIFRKVFAQNNLLVFAASLSLFFVGLVGSTWAPLLEKVGGYICSFYKSLVLSEHDRVCCMERFMWHWGIAYPKGICPYPKGCVLLVSLYL